MAWAEMHTWPPSHGHVRTIEQGLEVWHRCDRVAGMDVLCVIGTLQGRVAEI